MVPTLVLPIWVLTIGAVEMTEVHPNQLCGIDKSVCSLIRLKKDRQMKTLKIFAYMFALVCFSGAVSSCSSDDVEDNDGGAASALPAISGDISASDGNETRGSLKYNGQSALKLTWYEDDYIWAYSPKKKFYNKLVPVANQDFGEATRLRFVSEGKVDYEPEERLILLYSGYKTDDSKGSGVEEAVKQITFKKRNSTTLAMICGNSEDGRVFSDEGNYFFFKASSAVVGADGHLTMEASLRSYMPLLRIGIPASDANDATNLGNLHYTIKVSAKTEEHSDVYGFPESVTYSLLDENTGLGVNNTLAYPDNYYIWGQPYSLKLTPKATSNAFKSYSLWDDKDDHTKFELNGYVFIPIPALNYTELKVEVTVEKGNSDTDPDLSGLCGTYSYTTTNFQVGDKGTLNATAFDKEIVNRVLQLGNIWTRGTEQKGGAWSFTPASN